MAVIPISITIAVTIAVTEQNTKSFMENLRKLGNINSSIKEQQETLEKIRREIMI